MVRPPLRIAELARLADTGVPALDTAQPMWPGHRRYVDGLELHLRHTPAGHPDAPRAVFVHGLGGASGNWTDLATLLRPLRSVEALDLPGFGRSGPSPDGSYSPSAHARAVISYLDHSGGEAVDLIGNSLGGVVSILVAARRPDLVRSLTLISPAVPDVHRLRAHPLRSNPRAALVVVPGLGEYAIGQLARIDPELQVRSTISMCFASPQRYSSLRLRETVAEAEAHALLPWSGRAFLRSLRRLAALQFLHGGSLWSAMATITAPTLVLWGDTDRLVAPDLAPYVAAAIPRARLRVLTGVGHTAMMEDPVTTARAVVALLQDHDCVSRTQPATSSQWG